jgi:hypothetical protein
MKRIVSSLSLLFISIFIGCSVAGSASAYITEDLKLQSKGNIIVGPDKTEVLLAPGDTYSFELLVSNVSGMTKIVKFTTEDMTASDNPDESVVFLGNKTGPYSIKNFVKPEVDEVTLLTGQRLRMPVTITIPKDAEPGGLYGGLMVAAYNIGGPGEVNGETAAPSINIITRVASLLFITVKGNALQSGFLKDLTMSKSFYEAGPVAFEVSSANTGNVHLDPYGTIEIKDMFGRVVDTRQVEPWFVMPRSERVREIKWNSAFLIGSYTATLKMNRGYQDIVDSKTVSFWVLPWKLILIGLILLVLVIWFFVWIGSNIEWKKKKRK